MTKTTRPINPARPKTNPERALFLRKEFPLDPEVSFVGKAVVEVVSVTVTGPFGPLVENGGGDFEEGEDAVDTLCEF